ncbi:MAG TPA: matrixin family metalloprotease, partial [Planctomycetaceae bacterium]|nr:matrixin family metalloprotease [Planctomycetaceae bacterium]
RVEPRADERSGGRPFQRLGTVVVDAGTLTVTLTDDANGYVIADAVWVRGPASALVLDAPTEPALAAAPVADVDLQMLFAAALERWAEAGEGEDVLGPLGRLDLVTADLADGLLGLATDTAIYLDRDAAGRGWFVDRTPWEDSEFSRHRATDELMAQLGSPASGKVDLLSVLMHEVGHLIGLGHSRLRGVMSPSLPPGVRRVGVLSLGAAGESVLQSGGGQTGRADSDLRDLLFARWGDAGPI